MRYKITNPTQSDKRVIYKFLLFPKTIGNERRWWEWAYIKQDYFSGWDGGYWDDYMWSNEEEYNSYIKNKIPHIQRIS